MSDKATQAVQALMALSGLGLVSAGAWMAWRPAGLLVPGAILLAAAVAGALRGGKAGG